MADVLADVLGVIAGQSWTNLGGDEFIKRLGDPVVTNKSDLVRVTQWSQSTYAASFIFLLMIFPIERAA